MRDPTPSSPTSLAGKRVLVTRPGERGLRLALLLDQWGAEAILVPTIEFAPPLDPRPLRAATTHLETYDWAVFTSPRAVEAVRDSLRSASVDWPQDVRCAAVGPGTRTVLEAAGATVSAQPQEPRASAVVGALGDIRGLRILLPRSDLAHDELADGLRSAGARVDDVEAYRTLLRSPTSDDIAVLKKGSAAVVFASGSAVHGYLRAIASIPSEDGVPPSVVCIGPATAEVAAHAGLVVAAVAGETSDEAVVEAVAQALAVTSREDRARAHLAASSSA